MGTRYSTNNDLIILHKPSYDHISLPRTFIFYDNDSDITVTDDDLSDSFTNTENISTVTLDNKYIDLTFEYFISAELFEIDIENI